jgi:hypothetical protein
MLRLDGLDIITAATNRTPSTRKHVTFDVGVWHVKQGHRKRKETAELSTKERNKYISPARHPLELVEEPSGNKYRTRKEKRKLKIQNGPPPPPLSADNRKSKVQTKKTKGKISIQKPVIPDKPPKPI